VSGADRRVADGAARRLAQTEFRRPLVLEAGAGTGKTAALVARILAWCVGPGWKEAAAAGPGEDAEAVAGRVLDGVVAITFSEDAAAEMAERVAQGLAALERWDGATRPSREWPGLEVVVCPDGEPLTGLFAEAVPDDPPAVRERAQALLAQVERLRAGTIHAFARWILLRFPVEAGVHPGFEVDGDGRRLEAIAEAVVEEELVRAYRRGDPDALALAERGIGPAGVTAAAVELAALGVPAAALAEDPFAEGRVARVVAEIGAALGALEPELERLGGLGDRSADARVASWLLAISQALAGAGPAGGRLDTAASLAEERYAEAKGRLRDWARRKFTKGAAAALQDPRAFAERVRDLLVPLATLARTNRERFTAWRRLLSGILGRLEAERRRRGVLTYQDLLTLARRLLEKNDAVARELRRGIRQLVVDEVQDTDAEQAAIVRRLALEGPPGERPGLLLVGDPKQSIYGWRSADLEVYEALVRAVEAAGGKRRHLVVNFRSAAPILAEVERLVAPVMERRAGVQPAFEPLVPCTELADAGPHDGGGRRRVEHWASVAADGAGRPGRTRAADAARLEAEAVAAEIAGLEAEGVPLREIAILLRSRSQQEVFLEALRRRGIAYAVGADRTHYRTREVVEAVALVRLVLDPHDPLALAAVLRSPLVGVPDAALLPLWREGLPRLVAALGEGDGLPEGLGDAVRRAAAAVAGLALAPRDRELLGPLAGWPEALLRFCRTLAGLRRAAAGMPPDRFLEELRQRTFLEALAAGRFPGHYRLANLDRFLRELESLLLEGATRGEVLAWLRRVGRERPEEEAGRPREDLDGVRVLTVHGAKGLGFRHVYLVQTGAGTRGGRAGRGVRARRLDGRWELDLGGLPTPGFFRVAAREAEVEAAERVRLLYVALTRARDRLVTAGCWDPERSGETVFLDLLRRRRGGWPAGAREMWGESDPPEVERDGVRWVWLGHPERVTPEARPAVRAGAGPGAGRIEGDAAALERRRAKAAARMARPFLAGVTDEPHRRLEAAVAAAVEGGESAEEEAAAARLERRADVATAAGTAVHRILERFDLGAADPGAELARRREEAERWLAMALPPGLVPEARRHLDSLLAAFRDGPLWRRFLAIRPRVVARELPVLLPPGRCRAPGPGRPVGAVTGYIDLLYLSEEGGAPVVVDFKTDDPRWLQERAAAYAEQVRLYATALAGALGLDVRPRAELWFLAAGETVEVEGERG